MGRKELFHGTTQFYILLTKNALWTCRKSVLVTGGMHPAEPTQLFSPALRVEIEESVNPGFQHPGVSGNRPVFPLRSHRRFFAIYIYLIFLICDIESNLITFGGRNQPPVGK
jgi:hypothetical protein